MRKAISAAVLIFSSAALAAPVTDSAACETGEVYIGGYPPVLSYRWTEPAQFPTPSKLRVINKAWELECAKYSAKSDGNRVVFTSKTDRPEDALFPLRDGWPFYLNGYYKYPALSLDWVKFELSVKWDGQAKIEGTGTGIPAIIAGYKQSGGALKPYAFEGQTLPFSVSTDQGLELFLKAEAASNTPSWTYLSYDPVAKTLTLERVHPFPGN